MAAKRRNLRPEELLAAAETLQVAILDGIARARRWGKAELAFQGGTSLHLAYGSPRDDRLLSSPEHARTIAEAAARQLHAAAEVVDSPAPEPQARTVRSRTRVR